MRTPRAAAAAVVLTAIAVLMTAAGPAAQAEGVVPTTVTLARQPPDYPAVFHDRIDHGAGSLPGVDVVDYQAALTAAGLPLQDAEVVLQRRLVGESEWDDVGTATTGEDGTADFSTPVRGNATYQVTYAGGVLLAPATSDPVALRAMRDLNAYIPRGTADLKGNINPGWRRQVVSWQRRKCETCHWKTVARQRSSRSGGWRFEASLPRRGATWWFRAKVAGDPAFVPSTSSMLVFKR